MADDQARTAARSFLAAGGEMGARMRDFDWSATPVGPVEAWPQSLRTTVGLILSSCYPMTVVWGPDRIQFYNDGYMQLLGGKHPEALGLPLRRTFPEVWDTVDPMITGVLTTGEPVWAPDQLLVLERNGYPEECYFTLSYSPVRGDDGRIAGLLCVCSETTERLLSERRLKLLHALAARAGDARTVEVACRDVAAALADHPQDVPFALVYLRAPGGRRLVLHGRAGLAAGAPESPAVVDLGDPDGWPWPFVRAAAGETVLVDDLRAWADPLPGGSWPDPAKAALVMPIASSNEGPPAGVMVVGLSPRRALDDGYRSFFDLLAAQVSVAVANTRAYEEERRRAEALAEIDQAKTAFFSNVSHEFRTPLTLILGPLEQLLAESRLHPPEARGELELVHRNGLRLQKMVNALLDFSRIEAGRMQARYEPTDLAALTADLASTFRSAIEKAGLRLEVDCPPLPKPVHVDREMWEKIVLNLLSNAFKFTEQGTIGVALRIEDGAAVLTVRDTGTGIPADELPHLFERFHRIEGARSRTHEGSGIGLALVRDLAALHGGSVRVDSTVGVGAAFAVVLPHGTSHLPADRIVESREPARAGAGARVFAEEALRWLPDLAPGSADAPAEPPADGDDGALILLADDNADMRDYVCGLLGRYWTVHAVADGAAALAAARARVPDLVLSDVMMPGLDGLSLLKALRSDPRTAGVPVVLLSARAGEEARIEGLQADADDYLTKPFTARELVARVRTHLKLTRERRAAAERETAARADADAARRELAAKEAMLAEIHHRVKNNLQLVVSLLSFTSGGISDPDATQRLSVLRGRIISLGVIHNLLYQTDVASLIDSDFVHELCRTIKSSFAMDEVGLALEVPSFPMPVDTAVPLGLLINEAVSNAFKHAFQGIAQPRIEVTLKRTGKGHARLGVADNGIGMGGPRAGGLGLALMRGFAGQLDGTLDLATDGGTRIVLDFPLERH